MAEYFFELSQRDQREVLEVGRAASARPAHLLEKDLWVVWVLRALFESPMGADLTFKGGTSLSKVYRVIDRFSEDIDLTCDIRKLIPDLIGDGDALPRNDSQTRKWTKAVRRRLPQWITEQVAPHIQTALAKDKLNAQITSSQTDPNALQLHYPSHAQGTGYVAPVVTLEFGGRGTGEPHEQHPVVCDIAEYLPEVIFPAAFPLVMSLARTFWEKATAAHVFCLQGRRRGERYARHWHDLAAIARSPHFARVIADRSVAATVARHKSLFFRELDSTGGRIDYAAATAGRLRIIPDGEAMRILAEDYADMVADEVLIGDPLPFDALLDACVDLQAAVNAAADTGIG